MSFPDLTPTSTQSAITLPITGTLTDVVDSLAIGFYTSDAFVTGAVAQVAYTFKRLGGDILDIEIKAENVYNHYEEAVLEYSYILNLHQARNALGSALGGATGSFDHKGTVSGTADVALKYPKFQFDYAYRAADKFSMEATVGGTEPYYSASFDRVNNQAEYDLQAVVSSSQASNAWAGMGNKRVKIRQVYYITPRQMWRFYGYYGGLNVVGDMHNYGQYADDSSFQVIPVWQNKLQAIQYEDHLYTRTPHYSYEISDNNAYATGSFDTGVDGINNMNTMPMENIAFNKINSIGQQWVRKFSLALSKETLGQVRGKFGGNVPIPGDNITLNASDLLSQAQAEQTTLREELNKQLDEMLYAKIAETDKAMTDNMDSIVGKTPLKIFVG